MSERLSQLVELRRRPVQFHSDQVRDFHRLSQHRADIIQVCQNTVRIGVTFATKNFVAVDRELVEQIFLFGLGLFHEPWKRRLKGIQLAWINVEIRMKGDEVRKVLHAHTLHSGVESVQLGRVISLRVSLAYPGNYSG